MFGGAFENFNFMDLLVFGGIAFLLYKLFAAKAGAAQRQAYNRTNNYEESQSFQSNPAGFNTDVLFNKDKMPSTGQNFQQDAGFINTVAVPEGFDQQAFLSGAKIAFTTLQKA